MKILFVCTGNICRSPTAEGVFRHRLEAAGLAGRISADSAGTQGFHTGEAPDPRSIRAARARGVSIHGLRARQVSPADFTDFNLILALDASHLRSLTRMAPKGAQAELALFLAYAGHPRAREVPDPYYGSAADFEYVLDLAEEGADGLIARMMKQTA